MNTPKPEEPEKRPVPKGLEMPFEWNGKNRVRMWNGSSVLRFETDLLAGKAIVRFDSTPRPIWRFKFAPDDWKKDDLFDQLSRENRLTSAILETSGLFGSLHVEVNRQGEHLFGHIDRQVERTVQDVSSAKFVVVNGPLIIGQAIARESSLIAGRLTANWNNVSITLDRLNVTRRDERLSYSPTHVLRVAFHERISRKELDAVATSIFYALSLMKLQWVGLIGPWILNETGDLISIEPSVTKCERKSSISSWCYEGDFDSLQSVLPLLHTRLSDPKRRKATITALHWLVESEQCAGGIEGAIVLQQCALECLAWEEIVQSRKLCSNGGFKDLPAADKIRWLMSLFQISLEVPQKCLSILQYQKEFSDLKDLADILVDVRNALVHAQPNKIEKLFSRRNGDDERSELWYQTGGLLQQAILASLGYQGRIVRRDVEAKFVTSALRQVSWTS